MQTNKGFSRRSLRARATLSPEPFGLELMAERLVEGSKGSGREIKTFISMIPEQSLDHPALRQGLRHQLQRETQNID